MITKQSLKDAFVESVFQHIHIDPAELLPLLSFVTERDYPRKSSLLNVGDKWDRLFYIHQGLTRLFYTDVEGREFNKAFYWEGHCIWPVAPRDRNEGILFSIAALEDTVILEYSFQRLYDFLMQRGEWERFALPFAETLVEQKFRREHDLLLLSAAERFEVFSKAYADIVYRLPDYQLASFLGITNVTLSRIKRAAKG